MEKKEDTLVIPFPLMEKWDMVAVAFRARGLSSCNIQGQMLAKVYRLVNIYLFRSAFERG
jgi:hypothetical protein